MPESDRTPPFEPAIIGWVDEPHAEGVVGQDVRISGWALADGGIRAVEVRIFGHALRARYGLPREDVAAVYPDYPGNPHSGFELRADFSGYPAAPRVVRRTLRVVAIANDGRETEIGRRSLIDERAHARWRFLGDRPEPPFHLIPALSGVAGGGGFGLSTRYAGYESATAGPR